MSISPRAFEARSFNSRAILSEVFLPIPQGEDKLTMDDALSALMNLGYPPKSAKMAMERAKSRVKDMTLEDLIREALRILS